MSGRILEEVTPDLRSEGGAEANSMKREGKVQGTDSPVVKELCRKHVRGSGGGSGDQTRQVRGTPGTSQDENTGFIPKERKAMWRVGGAEI